MLMLTLLRVQFAQKASHVPPTKPLTPVMFRLDVLAKTNALMFPSSSI